MRMNLQPYEENQICLAFFRGTGENVQHLALLNSEQDIVHKIDFTDIIDLFTAAKPEKKTVLSVLFQGLAILDFVLICFWTQNSIAVSSI